MELDELKIELNRKFNAEHQKSSEDFALLLNKKTSSLIARIKRSIWIELISCIVFTIVFALVAIFSPYWSLKIYFAVFTLVCVAFLFVLRYLLKRTNEFAGTTLPVKSNLASLLSILREYIKRYFQLTMILIPFCLVFSFLLRYYDPGHSPSQNLTASITTSILIISAVIYTAALIVGVYYFTKWYLKKLYGNYLSQLEELIAELDEK